MRTRAGLLAAALFSLAACDVLFPEVPEPNLSGVGPSASEAAVEINYPDDAVPLAVSYFDLARRWNELTAPVAVLPTLPTSAMEGVVTAANDTSGVTLDIDVANGQINVAQLFVQKGSRDEDVVAVDAAIDAFLQSVSGEDGPLDATRAELGIAENMFSVREGEAILGGVVFWFAANEDAVLLGAIGR